MIHQSLKISTSFQIYNDHDNKIEILVWFQGFIGLLYKIDVLIDSNKYSHNMLSVQTWQIIFPNDKNIRYTV